MDPLVLPVKRDDVPSEELFVPSDGIRGSGKRVIKVFGVIPEWGGDFTVSVIDEKISEAVFASHVEAWGKFIGIGRFRPEKNGYYGRFAVKKIVWSPGIFWLRNFAAETSPFFAAMGGMNTLPSLVACMR